MVVYAHGGDDSEGILLELSYRTILVLVNSQTLPQLSGYDSSPFFKEKNTAVLVVHRRDQTVSWTL